MSVGGLVVAILIGLVILIVVNCTPREISPRFGLPHDHRDSEIERLRAALELEKAAARIAIDALQSYASPLAACDNYHAEHALEKIMVMGWRK